MAEDTSWAELNAEFLTGLIESMNGYVQLHVDHKGGWKDELYTIYLMVVDRGIPSCPRAWETDGFCYLMLRISNGYSGSTDFSVIASQGVVRVFRDGRLIKSDGSPWTFGFQKGDKVEIAVSYNMALRAVA